MSRRTHAGDVGLLFLALAFFTNCNSSNFNPPAETVAATSGSTQSALVNTAFAAPLVATVTMGGQPVSGAFVIFTAPSSGASGTFANGTNTESDTTNASGVATSTTFTANGTSGADTVTASVAGVTATTSFSLTNNSEPAASTTYVFYLSGLEAVNEDRGAPNYYALAGSLTIDANGDVLGGEQDYNDGFGLTSPQPSGDIIEPAASALVVDPTTGQGTLTLTTNNPNLGVNGVETLGVQFVNAKHALISQFDGTATSSGSLDTQTLSSALNDGNYAFTLSGVDSSYFSVVYGGVFSISASGTAVQGTFDVDDFGGSTTPTLATAFSGTIGGPDSFGRGTITSSALAISLNFYVVGPEAIRIIDVDAGDSGAGSVFGQGTTFSNASLRSSVFAVESNSFGSLYAAAGMFTVASGGVFHGVADDNEFDYDVIAPDSPISGTYSIASNGYGSLTIAAGDLGDVSALGIYMTDPSLNLNDPNNTTTGLGGALVADLDGFTLNGAGVLTPQTDRSIASFAGSYAFAAQDYNDFDAISMGREFDFVGQGLVKSGALSKATGLVSDPFTGLSTNPMDTGVRFSGTATPDGANPGRYTMRLGATVPGNNPVDFTVVIYQADGGQLFWVDEDVNNKSVFLGPLQQQGSLTGVPAALKATKPKAATLPREGLWRSR